MTRRDCPGLSVTVVVGTVTLGLAIFHLRETAKPAQFIISYINYKTFRDYDFYELKNGPS